MAHQFGKFVWFELVTPNVADAKAFWTEVGGFSTSEMEMGGNTYSMLASGKGTIGGVVAPQAAGVPPHWTSYVSVPDVAAAAKKVVANGGKVLVPATDIGMGIFALVADPQGATFNLWYSAQGDDNSATGVNWNELWAKNSASALKFYEGTFGYTHDEMAMPQGAYNVLKSGEAMVAGLMTAPDPNVPPMWLPYLEVDDVDAIVGRVRSNGGQVHAEPMVVEGVGKFAIVADRQGATVGVIRPASRA